MAGTLRVIPILTFICLPFTFLLSYLISVLVGNDLPPFPNISDTGTKPPESCVFSMFLNLTAALLAFTVYIRTKQIVEFVRSTGLDVKVPFVYYVNTASTTLGYITCIGLDLAANFQETNVRIVHDIGLVLCFWCGSFYAIIQCVITFWMSPQMNPFGLVIVRALLGVILFMIVIVNQTTSALAGGYFTAGNVTSTDLHIASSVSEWILMCTLAVFILSFFIDFQKVTVYTPELEMSDEPSGDGLDNNVTNYTTYHPFSEN